MTPFGVFLDAGEGVDCRSCQCIQQLVLWFANDGRVKREHVYFDMGTMMGQLGVGPKGAPVRPVEATPTAPTEMIIAKDGEAATDATAKSWFALAAKGDAKAVGAAATDDVVVSTQYMPADTKGKKALEKDVAEGAKAFVDQKMDVTTCVPVADVTACEYTWTATWKGPAMGMKPTGKTGTVHSVEIIKAKDGKVAATTAYANGAEFAASFGLMDEKPKGDPKAAPAGAGSAPAAAGTAAPKAGTPAPASTGTAPKPAGTEQSSSMTNPTGPVEPE